MPPLLLLQDIHLTIGTTRLLDGAELSLEEGEPPGPGGAQRLGQIHPAQDRRRPRRSRQAARASPSPAPPSAICRRSRAWKASPPPAIMSRPAWRRATIPTGPITCWAIWVSAGWKRPPRFRAAKPAAPPWRGCWRRGPIFFCWTSPPTISTCLRSNGWKANSKPCARRWC